MVTQSSDVGMEERNRTPDIGQTVLVDCLTSLQVKHFENGYRTTLDPFSQSSFHACLQLTIHASSHDTRSQISS